MEMPAVYICDRPKARKQHVCCECHGTIQKNEIYCNIHGVWDGQGATYKTCVDCHTLYDSISSMINDPEDRPALGSLHEAVFESRDPTTIREYLAIKMKRRAFIPSWMTERLIRATLEEPAAAKYWLIWSMQHRAWWAPHSNGYTDQREKAGRYSYKEATDILEQANKFTHNEPEEAMIPA